MPVALRANQKREEKRAAKLERIVEKNVFMHWCSRGCKHSGGMEKGSFFRINISQQMSLPFFCYFFATFLPLAIF